MGSAVEALGLQRTGPTVAVHRPSCSMAHGIFPDHGLNPCLLHWQLDSYLLSHQGSPVLSQLQGAISSHLSGMSPGWVWHSFSVVPPATVTVRNIKTCLQQAAENVASHILVRRIKAVLNSAVVKDVHGVVLAQARCTCSRQCFFFEWNWIISIFLASFRFTRPHQLVLRAVQEASKKICESN